MSSTITGSGKAVFAASRASPPTSSRTSSSSSSSTLTSLKSTVSRRSWACQARLRRRKTKVRANSRSNKSSQGTSPRTDSMVTSHKHNLSSLCRREQTARLATEATSTATSTPSKRCRRMRTDGRSKRGVQARARSSTGTTRKAKANSLALTFSMIPVRSGRPASTMLWTLGTIHSKKEACTTSRRRAKCSWRRSSSQT